jgi:copper chaperone
MVSFRVEDMTCGGCAARIDRALKALDATADGDTSVGDRLVRVRAQAGEAELAAAIRQAGYTPVKVEDSAAAMPASASCCCGSGGCSRT